MTNIISEEYQQEIKTRPSQRGKWLRSVPKYGWHCVRMVDRDGDDGDGWMFGEYCECVMTLSSTLKLRS